VGEPEHRREVLLGVDLKALVVHASVEVNREVGDAGDGAIDPKQRRGDAAALGAVGHLTGEAEVAVKPGVQERPAVDLHAPLAPALAGELGVGLEAQVGGVGVGADEVKPRALRGVVAEDPGDERPAAHDEALVPDLQGLEGLGLVHGHEARRLEPARGFSGAVLRARGGVDKLKQALGARGHRGSSDLAGLVTNPAEVVGGALVGAQHDHPGAGVGVQLFEPGDGLLDTLRRGLHKQGRLLFGDDLPFHQ
jgi:hypothetical protein